MENFAAYIYECCSFLIISIPLLDSWPFVQIHDWAIRAGKVHRMSMAWMLNLYIYVKDDETRAKWEEWTPNNNQWLMETAQAQAADSSFKGNSEISSTYVNHDKIHNYETLDLYGIEQGTNYTGGPYMPWWQCIPVLVSNGSQPVYNW